MCFFHFILIFYFNASQHNTCKGPFIATQLDVELRRQSVYSDADATQLYVELSTCSQCEQLSPINSECCDPVRVSIATQLNSTLSCVGKVSIATRRRNSTRRRAGLSFVAVSGPEDD